MTHTKTHYIAKSKTGRAVHEFHDLASAVAFREQRMAKGVHSDIWEVKTTETKVCVQ